MVKGKAVADLVACRLDFKVIIALVVVPGCLLLVAESIFRHCELFALKSQDVMMLILLSIRAHMQIWHAEEPQKG